MTTTLTYGDIALGYTPVASPTNGYPSTTELAGFIVDGDIDIKIRTKTTTESDERNLAIKSYVLARVRDFLKDSLGNGGDMISTQGGSAQFSPDPWKRYLELCEALKPYVNKSPYKFKKADFSGQYW